MNVRRVLVDKRHIVFPLAIAALAKLTTTYVLTGDYRDVRRFIYSLETAPEFIVLENVALTSAAEQPGRTLGMNLEIATYYRAADGS